MLPRPGRTRSIADQLEDDKDFEYDDAENLRPMLSIAGGNIAVWALAHLTGVVELIGVSFLASVGLLLGRLRAARVAPRPRGTRLPGRRAAAAGDDLLRC